MTEVCFLGRINQVSRVKQIMRLVIAQSTYFRMGHWTIRIPLGGARRLHERALQLSTRTLNNLSFPGFSCQKVWRASPYNPHRYSRCTWFPNMFSLRSPYRGQKVLFESNLNKAVLSTLFDTKFCKRFLITKEWRWTRPTVTLIVVLKTNYIPSTCDFHEFPTFVYLRREKWGVDFGRNQVGRNL